jgi:cation diffusion facilitator family transporter
MIHTDDLSPWMHNHVFDQGSDAAERSTRAVTWITAVMMIVEVIGGWWFNSMALLADGWHMSSHVVAIGLSAFAYAAARRYVQDKRFAFGTWKIEVLGGFASAIFLLVVAAMMVVGSLERLAMPQPIHYVEAIIIGTIGLLVNIVCAIILRGAHTHSHAHNDHAHDSHAHHDLNLKSAYVHVTADAATSVLAIAALAGGWWFGWSWLDPVMGLVGAVIVGLWARSLLRETGKVLLDREMDHPVVEEVREAIDRRAADGMTRITDLHVWRVGKYAWACALSLVTRDDHLSAKHVREWLSVHGEIAHVTIEIQRRN